MSEDWTPERLHAWLLPRFGDRVLTRIPAGNSRQIWKAGDLLVRVQVGTGLSDAYSLAREGHVYQQLNRIGATVPQLRAASDDGRVLVTDLAPGSPDLGDLEPVTRRAVLVDFVRRLTEIHAAPLPANGARVFDRPVPAGVAQCASDELAIWETIMRAAPREPSAVLEFGLRWLRENVPPVDGTPVLVHGDAGPGNFLQQNGAVTAVIDWEFAHPGDPVEDLAWIFMRGALDRVPEVHDVLAGTEGFAAAERSGRFGYYLATVLWKVMVVRHAAWGDTDSNVGRNLYFGLAHRRMFVEVMARNLGLPEPEVGASPAVPTGREWLYDYGIAQIKGVGLPAITDAAAQQRFAGLVRVLRYLKAMDRGARWLPDDAATARSIRDGGLDNGTAFAAVAEGVLREVALCREVIGSAGLPRLW